MRNYLFTAWQRVTTSVFFGLIVIGGMQNVSAFADNKGEVKLIKDQSAEKAFSTNSAAACTYTLSATSVNIPLSGGTGSVTVSTDEGCPWSVSSNVPWINANLNATGTATLVVTLQSNNGIPRTGTLNVAGQIFTINQTDVFSPTTSNRAPFDFDGDNKSDFSIFRPSAGEWWYLRSSDVGNNAFQFGIATDVMTPGDYTGDGKWDFAFYRPSNGTWYILRSEDGSYYAFPFGLGT
ncbi:MAG TPA: BACON domain-containing protein, partial [Pyrinomonadaceae bacterium]